MKNIFLFLFLFSLTSCSFKYKIKNNADFNGKVVAQIVSGQSIDKAYGVIFPLADKYYDPHVYFYGESITPNDKIKLQHLFRHVLSERSDTITKLNFDDYTPIAFTEKSITENLVNKGDYIIRYSPLHPTRDRGLFYLYEFLVSNQTVENEIFFYGVNKVEFERKRKKLKRITRKDDLKPLTFWNFFTME